MSFKIILQGSAIVLIFAWVALGPYSAYYQQFLDQIRTPFEIAYRAVSNAVYDVYLLATNPTEWYARQQVLNARPEHPIDFPKGVEVMSLDALPPSVPGGQEFAITMILRNQGTMRASEISLTAECNQWCDVRSATAVPSFPEGASVVRSALIRDYMERGESEAVTIKPIRAKYFRQRAAEMNLAKITINLSYATSTNSSLLISVINKEELDRRFRDGDLVFKSVTAVSKTTPAQLSLNVGPQPIKAGTTSQFLLVSVQNTRDFSKVILPRGTKIIVRLPEFLVKRGQGSVPFSCGKFTPVPQGNEDYKQGFHTIVYTIETASKNQESIEILANEFNSIFAFICQFDVAEDADIQTTQTGLATAELPNYIFRVEQKKDVPVTAPLGILFDPFDQTCNAVCGEGTAVSIPYAPDIPNTCGANECHTIRDSRDPEARCYYSSTFGKDVSGRGQQCFSCGPKESRSCEIFGDEATCETESKVCNLNCKWLNLQDIADLGENVDKTTRTYFQKGRCEEEKIVALSPESTPSTAPSLTSCQGMDTNAYNLYKTEIENAVQSTGLETIASREGYNAKALLAALITQESGRNWNPNAVSICGAAGLTQFVPGTARDPRIGLMVPQYPFVPTSNCGKYEKISSCNSITPSECQKDIDERFDPAKAILASAKYLVTQINLCNSVPKGVAAYNSGNCGGEANTGYTTKIINDYYPKWAACVQEAGITNACTSCISAGRVWCTDDLTSISTGFCIPTAPCQTAYFISQNNGQTCPSQGTSYTSTGQLWSINGGQLGQFTYVGNTARMRVTQATEIDAYITFTIYGQSYVNGEWVDMDCGGALNNLGSLVYSKIDKRFVSSPMCNTNDQQSSDASINGISADVNQRNLVLTMNYI